MSEFAAVIGYSFDNVNVETIILDTLNEPKITGQSVITSQPMVNGDMISDHMYLQPKTLSLDGTLALNGSKITVINGEGCKLANFQDLCEKIQREGVLCEIYKISTNNDKDIRFLHRGHMALESFTWTEGINTLDYTLNFREVIFTNIVETKVDIDDDLLPNITEPDTLSFTTTLVDWNQIDTSVIDTIEKEKLWTTAFKNTISSMNQGTLQTTVGLAAANIVAAVVAGLATAGGAAGLAIGAVVVAVAAAVGAIYIFFKGLADSIREAKRRQKYAIKVFETYKNEHKTQEEIKRFADFVEGIHKSFESINDLIQVYQVSENKEQECLIQVDYELLTFKFHKNNTTGVYDLNVWNVDHSLTKSMNNVTSAKKNFSQLTHTDALITTKNNASLYLLCPSDDTKDLRNYFIVVCNFEIDKFQEMINKVISKAIFKKGENE